MSDSHQIYNGKARDFHELCEAFRLVQQKYEEQGYAKPTPSGMRYTVFNLLKETSTFVAAFDKKVVATSSLIEDSFFSLPLSKDYFPEFTFLRKSYGKIAEGSMFACESDFQNKGMGVQLSLLKQILAKCLERGVNALCLIVNPKHLGFYQKVLGFNLLSESRTCAHVEDAPGFLIYKKIEKDPSDKTLFAKLLSNAEEMKLDSNNEYFPSNLEIKKLLKLNPLVYLGLTLKEKEYLLNLMAGDKQTGLNSKEAIILSKEFQI